MIGGDALREQRRKILALVRPYRDALTAPADDSRAA